MWQVGRYHSQGTAFAKIAWRLLNLRVTLSRPTMIHKEQASFHPLWAQSVMLAVACTVLLCPAQDPRTARISVDTWYTTFSNSDYLPHERSCRLVPESNLAPLSSQFTQIYLLLPSLIKSYQQPNRLHYHQAPYPSTWGPQSPNRGHTKEQISVMT